MSELLPVRVLCTGQFASRARGDSVPVSWVQSQEFSALLWNGGIPPAPQPGVLDPPSPGGPVLTGAGAWPQSSTRLGGFQALGTAGH